MSAAADAQDWPQLVHPVELVAREDEWIFRSSVAAGSGVARLLAWRMPDRGRRELCGGAGGHVVAVTDLGVGASVTNSAEHIWAVMLTQFGEPLVLLEHYRAEPGAGPLGAEHVDQVVVDPEHGVRWRRIWPTPPEHPQHDEFDGWILPLRELVLGGDRPEGER